MQSDVVALTASRSFSTFPSESREQEEIRDRRAGGKLG